MATQTRNPTSEVVITGTWSGTSRHLLLDDYPDSANPIADGTACSAAGVAMFGFSPFTVPVGATSLSIQVRYYDFKAASQSSSIGAAIRCNDTTNRLAAAHNPGNGNAAIAARSDSYATNPKSGAAWTVNDVNGVGTNGLTAFGLSCTDASPAVTVSCVQLQVTYTISYTFTVDSGSYSLTGSTVGFRLDRNLAASAGTYSCGGQMLTLRVSRQLSVVAGSYGLSGSAVGFQKGVNFAVGSGSYQFSGNAVRLSRGLRLSSSAWSYSLTGSVASLKLSHRIATASGAYSSTGSAAGLRASREIGLGVGAHALTGSAVRLLASRRLVGAAGSYAQSGIAARVLWQLRLISGAGSYFWQGSDVGLTLESAPTGYALAVGAGQYQVFGQAVAFRLDHRLSAAVGSHAWTGAVAGLAMSRRVVPGLGVYWLAGSDVTLTVGTAPPVEQLVSSIGAIPMFTVKLSARPVMDSGFDSAVGDD